MTGGGEGRKGRSEILGKIVGMGWSERHAKEMGLGELEDISKACGAAEKWKPGFLRFHPSSITSCVTLGQFLNLSVRECPHPLRGTNTLGVVDAGLCGFKAMLVQRGSVGGPTGW